MAGGSPPFDDGDPRAIYIRMCSTRPASARYNGIKSDNWRHIDHGQRDTRSNGPPTNVWTHT